MARSRAVVVCTLLCCGFLPLLGGLPDPLRWFSSAASAPFAAPPAPSAAVDPLPADPPGVAAAAAAAWSPGRFQEVEVEVPPRTTPLPAGVLLPVRLPLSEVLQQLDAGRGLALQRIESSGERTAIPVQADVRGMPALVFLHEPSELATRYVVTHRQSANVPSPEEPSVKGAVALDSQEVDPTTARAVPDPECWQLESGDDGVLRLRWNERDVIGYCFGPQLKEGIDPALQRSTYVRHWFPADNSGPDLLDDFPEDHLHHRGISWMWPRVRIGTDEYDLWTLRGIEQRFEAFHERIAGCVFASVVVHNGWYVGERRVVDEKLRLCAYRPFSDGAQAGQIVLDLELELTAVDEPVWLAGQVEEEKGYGGVGFRIAPAADLGLVTDVGVLEEDSLHRRFAWAGLFGALRGGSKRGLVQFSHPQNPGHPSEWLLRHYGYVGESWPGLDPVELAPGAPLRLRHRFLSFVGGVADAGLSGHAAQYAQPAQPRVIAVR